LFPYSVGVFTPWNKTGSRKSERSRMAVSTVMNVMKAAESSNGGHNGGRQVNKHWSVGRHCGLTSGHPFRVVFFFFFFFLAGPRGLKRSDSKACWGFCPKVWIPDQRLTLHRCVVCQSGRQYILLDTWLSNGQRASKSDKPGAIEKYAAR
jgi:hypothetical protein